MVRYWGRQWYKLGKSNEEALQAFEEKLASIVETLKIEAHSLDHLIGTLPPTINPMQPAVYFLLDSCREVIYVGQSKNPLSRLLAHREKDFACALLLPTEEEHLLATEAVYISKFKPKLNYQIAKTDAEIDYTE